MRINSDGIVALGESLEGVADTLDEDAAGTRGEASDGFGFVDGSAKGAYRAVRGEYELVRIALCEQVRSLAELARQAGGCYLAAEEQVGAGFGAKQ